MTTLGTAHGFVLFDTVIGRCGIAWGGRGVVGVQLPEGSDIATRTRMLQRFPDTPEAPPPPEVQRAVDGIAALLRGEASDLSAVVLDMDGVPPFHRRVYEVARTIAPGATQSYGDIAERLGARGSARAVGQALGRNPFAIVVPCHRVLAAGGKVGGFSAGGGTTTKLRLLSIEGAPVADTHAGGGAPTFVAPTLCNERADRAMTTVVFGCDPAVAVEQLRASDAALARLIDAVGPFDMPIDQAPSTFAALAEATVRQTSMSECPHDTEPAGIGLRQGEQRPRGNRA